MNKREVTELKRRLNKSNVTFKRLAGCYVDGNGNKICTFNSPFLTLADEEFFKYLEIANKLLSGSVKNNLLNLEFPLSEEEPGGHQTFLMGLRESGLENEGLLDAWYDLVIKTYKHTGNYLIVLFLDSYDVPLKTSDELKLDESVEVFTYMLAAVCPVELSKPGLGYIENEKRIGSRVRDWVVGSPETGFLFPAFNHRSTDIHATLFYTKDTKAPHAEFMGDVLGCPVEQTSEEKKNTFTKIVKQVLGEEDVETTDNYLYLQRNLSDLKDQHDEAYGDEKEIPDFVLNKQVLMEALDDTPIPEEKRNRISSVVSKTFEKEDPTVEAVLDKRAIKNNIDRLDKNELEVELSKANHELKEAKDQIEVLKNAPNLSDIVLNVTEDCAAEIKTKIVDGERYILIPYSGSESVMINGEEANLF